MRLGDGRRLVHHTLAQPLFRVLPAQLTRMLERLLGQVLNVRHRLYLLPAPWWQLAHAHRRHLLERVLRLTLVLARVVAAGSSRGHHPLGLLFFALSLGRADWCDGGGGRGGGGGSGAGLHGRHLEGHGLAGQAHHHEGRALGVGLVGDHDVQGLAARVGEGELDRHLPWSPARRSSSGCRNSISQRDATRAPLQQAWSPEGSSLDAGGPGVH